MPRMKIRNLLQALDQKEFFGSGDEEISSITAHSGSAAAGSLFVAVPGAKADGHDFLESAYRSGARAFVTSKPFEKTGASTIVVPDCREALAALAAAFHSHPSQKIGLIGITGTNGKTTTAFLLESVLKQAGLSTGVLSTIEYRFASCRQAADRTTPDPTVTQNILRQMVDAGTDYAVMEISSHGLKQKRVNGCHFNIGIFTNLTPEHLDYHKTMNDYFETKELLFSEVLAASSKKRIAAVVNRDDPRHDRLVRRINYQTIGFGINSGDVRADNISLSLEGISADVVAGQTRFSITSPLLGAFNLYNILAAAAAALFLKIPPGTISAGIAGTAAVPGRMERIENTRGLLIFVDYAHTGDALENVLKTLTAAGASRIITVFGCGGDRDREKRPVMGAIAARHSTVVILTSDNPRGERPEQIISEIEQGVRAGGLRRVPENHLTADGAGVYTVCPDRQSAIRSSITLARAGDVVLIAGKGHETFQQTGTEILHFDDREEVRKALQMGA